MRAYLAFDLKYNDNFLIKSETVNYSSNSFIYLLVDGSKRGAILRSVFNREFTLIEVKATDQQHLKVVTRSARKSLLRIFEHKKLLFNNEKDDMLLIKKVKFRQCQVRHQTFLAFCMHNLWYTISSKTTPQELFLPVSDIVFFETLVLIFSSNRFNTLFQHNCKICSQLTSRSIKL